jgi:hypothetical protein
MNRSLIWSWVLGLTALLGSAAGTRALAQEDVDVSINTSSIAGETGSELYVDLIGGGSDTAGGYNSATLSAISLGGGTAGAIDTSPFGTVGDASGSLTGSIALDDQDGSYNQFAEFLTPGSQLSFQLDLSGTTNTSGSIPDELSLYLYDQNGFPLPSSDPLGSLMQVTFNTSSPSVSNNAPALLSVSSVVAAAPEIDPSSALAALTLLAGGLMILRGRRSRSPPRH